MRGIYQNKTIHFQDLRRETTIDKREKNHCAMDDVIKLPLLFKKSFCLEKRVYICWKKQQQQKIYMKLNFSNITNGKSDIIFYIEKKNVYDLHSCKKDKLIEIIRSGRFLKRKGEDRHAIRQAERSKGT